MRRQSLQWLGTPTNGDVEKATELFRSIVKHHWLSPECTIALNYLVRGRHLPALRANSGFENRT
jgi:hypothetical protein